MRSKAYQNNNLITQTVEENEYTIEDTTEDITVLGQMFTHTYNFSKGIKFRKFKTKFIVINKQPK